MFWSVWITILLRIASILHFLLSTNSNSKFSVSVKKYYRLDSCDFSTWASDSSRFFRVTECEFKDSLVIAINYYDRVKITLKRQLAVLSSLTHGLEKICLWSSLAGYSSKVLSKLPSYLFRLCWGKVTGSSLSFPHKPTGETDVAWGGLVFSGDGIGH